MGRSWAFRSLLATNAVLAIALVCHGYRRGPADDASVISAGRGPDSAEKQFPAPSEPETVTRESVQSTPFAQVYSTDPATFAANLRAIGCPEQTVRDIIAAEVHRRFKEQGEKLRPTPADHVPFGWSARTTEPRLLERREEAAELAREESATLRDALGCTETVAVPLYAMTMSDLRFESQIASSPNLDACGLRQVDDTYWADVQALVQRTKDFWLPQDLEELQALKEKRQLALRAYLPQQ